MQRERAWCWNMQHYHPAQSVMRSVNSDGNNPKDAPRKPELTWKWKRKSLHEHQSSETYDGFWSLRIGRNQALYWKAETVLMCQYLLTNIFTNTKWHMTSRSTVRCVLTWLYYRRSKREESEKNKSGDPFSKSDLKFLSLYFYQDKSVKTWWGVFLCFLLYPLYTLCVLSECVEKQIVVHVSLLWSKVLQQLHLSKCFLCLMTDSVIVKNVSSHEKKLFGWIF